VSGGTKGSDSLLALTANQCKIIKHPVQLLASRVDHIQMIRFWCPMKLALQNVGCR
jgi:hypothetical protein